MSEPTGGWFKLVHYPDRGWAVRISLDDGLEVQSKEIFATRELAIAYFNNYAREHDIGLGERAQ